MNRLGLLLLFVPSLAIASKTNPTFNGQSVFDITHAHALVYPAQCRAHSADSSARICSLSDKADNTTTEWLIGYASTAYDDVSLARYFADQATIQAMADASIKHSPEPVRSEGNVVRWISEKSNRPIYLVKQGQNANDGRWQITAAISGTMAEELDLQYRFARDARTLEVVQEPTGETTALQGDLAQKEPAPTVLPNKINIGQCHYSWYEYLKKEIGGYGYDQGPTEVFAAYVDSVVDARLKVPSGAR